jgi:hypothetical protein
MDRLNRNRRWTVGTSVLVNTGGAPESRSMQRGRYLGDGVGGDGFGG